MGRLGQAERRPNTRIGCRSVGSSLRSTQPAFGATRLMAMLLMASMTGSPSAKAEDRSDAMLRAFQDTCFPHLNDLATQRQRITEAGFVQSPRVEIQGVELNGETVVVITGSGGVERSVSASEHYRRQHDGLALFLSEITLGGTRHIQCWLDDVAADAPVSDEKLADWIGRPADANSPAPWAPHRSVWAKRFGALPDGYDEIASEFRAGHPCCSGAALFTAASAKVP
jgi:hypothetical protein